MKLIGFFLLMLIAPIMNMAGLVELRTLRDIGFGVCIGVVLQALPERFPRWLDGPTSDT